MAYVDYEYYVNGYLLGREPTVPEKLFRYWEKQACTEVDAFTFGRLNADTTLVNDQVKDCCCEITELLYQADSVAQQALQQGASGPLSSYNNDGESGTIDLSQSIYTEEGKTKKIYEIICRYLGNTGLLYTGVR